VSAELDEKTERLCSLAAVEGVAGILINSQPNFGWLTCGGTNGVDQSRENGVSSLLVTSEGRWFILASKIEMPRMLAEEVSAADFQPVAYAWQDEKRDSSLVGELASKLAGGGVIPETMLGSKIDSCRYALTGGEQERYRVLGREASAALERVIARIFPGFSEIEIAEVLRQELATAGISSIVTLIAADERIAQFRHPVPTIKRWTKELLLVTCARRHGLTANLSRMISVGLPSDEIRKRTEAAAYVFADLLHATEPGCTGSDLYTVAASAYAKRGFADEIDRHHQGGATGYRTRDWVAHPTSVDRVQAFQAFAWNPSISGTKIEETVLVTDGGVEMLTDTGRWPTITTTVEGTEYTAAGILPI
jgi:methionine aminopeptidase